MRRSLGVALVLWASIASATTLVYRDVPELTRTSDAVVRGKVLRAESAWTGDHRRIVTRVEVAVDETLKGAAQKTVTIIQPGGQVGDIGQKVSGLATFAPGEEVVVFLQRRGGDFLVNGMALGKFRVERSTDQKAAFAVPDPAAQEAVLLDPLTRAPLEVQRETLRLEELKLRVEKALPPKGTK